MDTMIEMLSYGMLISGAITFIILISGFKATYGRYSQQSHLPVFFFFFYIILIIVVVIAMIDQL